MWDPPEPGIKLMSSALSGRFLTTRLPRKFLGALLRPCHKWFQGSSVHGILSRQEYWSGLPFSPPGNLPAPGIETAAPAAPELQVNALLVSQKWLPGVNSEPLTLLCPFQTGLFGDLPKLDIHSLLGVWFANIVSCCIAAFSRFPLLWGGSYMLHHSLTFAFVVKSKPLWPRLTSGSLLLSSGNFMVSHFTSKS